MFSWRGLTWEPRGVKGGMASLVVVGRPGAGPGQGCPRGVPARGGEAPDEGRRGGGACPDLESFASISVGRCKRKRLPVAVIQSENCRRIAPAPRVGEWDNEARETGHQRRYNSASWLVRRERQGPILIFFLSEVANAAALTDAWATRKYSSFSLAAQAASLPTLPSMPP